MGHKRTVKKTSAVIEACLALVKADTAGTTFALPHNFPLLDGPELAERFASTDALLVALSGQYLCEWLSRQTFVLFWAHYLAHARVGPAQRAWNPDHFVCDFAIPKRILEELDSLRAKLTADDLREFSRRDSQLSGLLANLQGHLEAQSLESGGPVEQAPYMRLSLFRRGQRAVEAVRAEAEGCISREVVLACYDDVRAEAASDADALNMHSTLVHPYEQLRSELQALLEAEAGDEVAGGVRSRLDKLLAAGLMLSVVARIRRKLSEHRDRIAENKGVISRLKDCLRIIDLAGKKGYLENQDLLKAEVQNILDVVTCDKLKSPLEISKESSVGKKSSKRRSSARRASPKKRYKRDITSYPGSSGSVSSRFSPGGSSSGARADSPRGKSSARDSSPKKRCKSDRTSYPGSCGSMSSRFSHKENENLHPGSSSRSTADPPRDKSSVRGCSPNKGHDSNITSYPRSSGSVSSSSPGGSYSGARADSPSRKSSARDSSHKKRCKSDRTTYPGSSGSVSSRFSPEVSSSGAREDSPRDKSSVRGCSPNKGHDSNITSYPRSSGSVSSRCSPKRNKTSHSRSSSGSSADSSREKSSVKDSSSENGCKSDITSQPGSFGSGSSSLCTTHPRSFSISGSPKKESMRKDSISPSKRTNSKPVQDDQDSQGNNCSETQRKKSKTAIEAAREVPSANLATEEALEPGEIVEYEKEDIHFASDMTMSPEPCSPAYRRSSPYYASGPPEYPPGSPSYAPFPLGNPYSSPGAEEALEPGEIDEDEKEDIHLASNMSISHVPCSPAYRRPSPSYASSPPEYPPRSPSYAPFPLGNPYSSPSALYPPPRRAYHPTEAPERPGSFHHFISLFYKLDNPGHAGELRGLLQSLSMSRRSALLDRLLESTPAGPGVIEESFAGLVRGSDALLRVRAAMQSFYQNLLGLLRIIRSVIGEEEEIVTPEASSTRRIDRFIRGLHSLHLPSYRRAIEPWLRELMQYSLPQAVDEIFSEAVPGVSGLESLQGSTRDKIEASASYRNLYITCFHLNNHLLKLVRSAYLAQSGPDYLP